MSRNVFGNKKIIKVDRHTRTKYIQWDITKEKLKIALWIVLGVLYTYYIIQPQIHF
jgi:hypothetical protein